MNSLFAGLAGGFAGATCTTLLHECIRHGYDAAPRLDKLGEQALSKAIDAVGDVHVSNRQLYLGSMAGDIISNALYYATAAGCPDPVIAGTTLGLLAGAGAVVLPGRMGLDPGHTNATASRRWLTIGLYTVGGLVAGVVIRSLRTTQKQ